MLFHSGVLRGFTAGLSVRYPSTSQVPISLRSTSPTMSEQDAPKTYLPPNPVQDGMKTYEVRPTDLLDRLLVVHVVCSAREGLLDVAFPGALMTRETLCRALDVCPKLCFYVFGSLTKLASNSFLLSSLFEQTELLCWSVVAGTYVDQHVPRHQQPAGACCMPAAVICNPVLLCISKDPEA